MITPILTDFVSAVGGLVATRFDRVFAAAWTLVVWFVSVLASPDAFVWTWCVISVIVSTLLEQRGWRGSIGWYSRSSAGWPNLERQPPFAFPLALRSALRRELAVCWSIGWCACCVAA